MYGVVHVPLAPLREAPSLKAAMLSQLLAGELMEILDAEHSWYLVMNLYDGLKGWVDPKMVEVLLDGMEDTIEASVQGIVPAPLMLARDQYGRSFYLPGGARIYSHGSSVAVAPGRNLENDIVGGLVKPVYKSRKRLINTAIAYNGAPCLPGGKSVFGIDCAGLLQITCQLNGLRMPRELAKQLELGDVVGLNAEALPGDLAFFENVEGNIVHAGLVMDGGRIVHAFGEVRVDMFDHEGIFNRHTRQYTHKLRVIKRIVPG